MDHYVPLCDDCSIILGTTTHLFVSVLTFWEALHTSFPILGPQPTSFRIWYYPVDHYPPLCDCSIVLGTTTHLFVTVWSSLGPLRTSLWVFYHLVDPYLLLYDSSVILKTTTNLFVSVIHSENRCLPLSSYWEQLGTTTHHFQTVLLSWGPLYTSLWPLIILRDQYLPLCDCSIILGTSIHLFASVLSSWGPLPTSSWMF